METILGPFWDSSSFLLMVTYFDFLRTYFDTRLSMSSFTPSNTEEGPKAPEGPEGPSSPP